ncbi:uncharacterized protein LOC107426584 [Ziziphus jujuba]|uniref:Uncharacterized protein LOC107426584 n=2 Tax=Ziziphus jujuba TaxID=326968 RepID=A0A6P4AD59_ZIZJJ|nr:uncharacterized protein LOC107426584 [Ziziphus jujuba]KAH7517616.1 hypothetical protein FEM48_Zijuj09G0083700 [Ziziphus jujuba var. spinosa]
MVGFVRTKRVTDPLDDRVKARLVGRDVSRLSYVSSGSEYSGEDDSPCLSELVHDFLQDHDESAETRRLPDYESESERIDSVADCTDAIEIVTGLTASSGNVDSDSYKELLSAHVFKAAESFSRLRSNRVAFRRSVMQFLRELGHNAAICKTRWNSSGGITAGNYEFIDVVVQSGSSSSRHNRYFIDLDFASEFQIARPSAYYTRLLQSLPTIFIGNAEDLKRLVRVICNAAKISLKSTELSVPPWRKNRYMQNKWFASYRRTVNPAPENSFSSLVPASGIKCRWIGFDAGVSDSNVNGHMFVRIR